MLHWMERTRRAGWAAILLACGLGVGGGRAAEVSIEPADGGKKMTVRVDGQPFAEYLTRNGHQPVIWPIYGPDQRMMTRSFPLGPKLAGETDDHPHHRSLWFSHGEVNGEDFWTEPESRGRGAKQNLIEHRQFLEPAEGGIKAKGSARIVTRNEWTSDGQKICEDVRTIDFGADEYGRWIDFAVEVTATAGDVAFGDTKEGAFGLRVAGTMAVDAHKGGKILNSRGQVDAVAWGQRAEWVDYRGPVDGKPAGITVFDMPDSFRHPTRWHVRTYGLFAANPFGERDFNPAQDVLPGEKAQGEAKLAKGEKLRLHYRVLFHRGDLTIPQLKEIYQRSAGKLATADKRN